MIEIHEIRTALRKLLSYNYYDKNDLVSRRMVADFVNSLGTEENEERILSEICDVANGNKKDLLDSWAKQIRLAYYPKKLYAKEYESTKVVSNVPDREVRIERLLVKSYFPVELLILDTLWVLEYGYLIDRCLNDKCCWGNRLDLTSDAREVKLGDALFLRYPQQYRKWWENGLKAANKHLEEGTNVSIISFDISNCYHSINFDFDEFFKVPEMTDFSDAPLNSVLVSIYQGYWEQVKLSNLEMYRRDVCCPLPLNLLSAHILSNWYLSPLEDYITSTYQPLYFGRYVDDCMLVCDTKSTSENVYEAICEELPDFFHRKDDIFFAKPELSRLSGLRVQESKLYLYRFNCKLPQPTIEDSLNDFMERSSEYRFLTEDEDPNSSSLEDVTLVNALEPVEDAGKRFNILEENRFLLSVYLSKVATQLSVYGKEYERLEEVDKIFRYFQESLLIKHYLMWERILTIFVLSEKMDYVETFCQRCKDVIDRIVLHDSLRGLTDSDIVNLRDTLIGHLGESYLMAISLRGKLENVPSIYLDTYMLRMRYNRYPMQEFSDNFQERGINISWPDICFSQKLYNYRWLPYYKPLYEVVSAKSLMGNYSNTMMKESFELYRQINRIDDKDRFEVYCHTSDKEKWAEFNTSREFDNDEDVITVAVVEMDLSEVEVNDVLNKQGVVDSGKMDTIRGALDKVTKSEAAIFVMPELSLPIYELLETCRYSAKKKKAFVAGLEYVVSDKEVRNYLITCLPVSLYGRKDALPVIRMKNFYAPKEQLTITNDLKLKVPLVDEPWQMLYHWKGHVFTSYMCFELTSIKDRSYFMSKIDAMYSSVFNKDTSYFNNIAESCSRDMHCYYIQANVSHLGDSRVTQPSKQYNMNLLRVKGGNTSSNKSVVLTSELDIAGLRSFQKLDVATQDEQKEKFKFTPPSFSQAELKDRINKRFIMPYENPWEEMLAGLNMIFMKY